MKFVAPPPRRTRQDETLYPPLVVRLDGALNGTGKTYQGRQPFVVLSLLDEGGKASLSPSRNDLLSGNLAGIVNPLNHLANGSRGSSTGPVLGVATFEDVTIRAPGRYRLQASLFQPDAEGTGGPLQEMVSDVIQVDKWGGIVKDPCICPESRYDCGWKVVHNLFFSHRRQKIQNTMLAC